MATNLMLRIFPPHIGLSADQAIECLTGFLPLDETIKALDGQISNESKEFWETLALKYSQSDKQGNFWETLAPEEAAIKNDDLSVWRNLEVLRDSQNHNILAFHKPPHTAPHRAYIVYLLDLSVYSGKEKSIAFLKRLIREHFIKKGLVATYVLLWNNQQPSAYIQVSSKTTQGSTGTALAPNHGLLIPIGTSETKTPSC